ncbi:MAG: hypothetical protein KatS3mg110_0094 [Pirellulaceae bacterium]|nr:MAG: hypothetical protein KatS3mg110_0094 [Pirellulaceae bacterium]
MPSRFRTLVGSWFGLVTLMIWVVGTPAHAQLPTTELHWLFPAGAKAGSTVDLRVGGGNQEEATQLVFSHPGIRAAIKTAPVNEFLPEPVPQFGQFTVTVADDVPAGIYDVWLVGRFGVSNVKSFMVSHWEELVDDGSNHSLQQAREVTVGTVVNGILDARQLDYYRVHLPAGARLLVDCWAQRLDSRANATLVLFDSRGRELARNLDYAGYDPFLDFTAPAEGDYVIAVYDFYFAGGNDFFYRLAFHQGPHVDSVFPIAGLAGTETTFEILGRGLPGGNAAEQWVLDGISLEKSALRVVLPKEQIGSQVFTRLLPSAASVEQIALPVPGTVPVGVGISPVPVVLEQEPNSQAEQAQMLHIPCEVNGRFYPELDTDWFQFEAKKGDRYIIEVISQRITGTTDPFILIQRVTTDAQGNVSATIVAEVDDPPNRANFIGRTFDYLTDDPEYEFVVPEDGMYRILVRDQAEPHAKDPRRVYRLQIRPPMPDFRVYGCPEQVKVDNNNQVRFASLVLRRQDVCWMKVVVDRRDGFRGEVTIEAQGLPEGVHCRPVILDSNQSEAWLAFEASAQAAPWVGPIAVTGRALIEGQEVTRPLQPASIVWGTGNVQQERPEFRLTRQLYLSVIGDMAPAAVVAGEDQVYETSLGGTVEIPVKLLRRDDFKEALKFTAQNIPNELKPADINIAADASEATLKVAVTNNNAKPGVYTFYLRADSKSKLVRHPEAVARIEQQLKQIAERIAAFEEELKQAAAAVEQAAAAQKAAAEKIMQAEQAVTLLEKMVAEAKAAAEQAAAQAQKAREASAGQPDDAALAEAATTAQKEADQAARRHAELEKQLSEARGALTEARRIEEQARADQERAAQARKNLEETLKRANEAKAALDKQAADIRKANQPGNVNVAILSAPIRLRIHPSPLALRLPDAPQRTARGQSVSVPVRVERRFGFAGAVELAVQLPQGTQGLKVENVTLPADQQEANLVIETAAEAPAGQIPLTIQAKAKFNNFNVQSDGNLVLEIVP